MITKLLRTPFARPPGRRSISARFAPEICALAVVGAGILYYQVTQHYWSVLPDFPAVVGLIPGATRWSALQHAAAMAYGIAGLFIVFGALRTVASSLPGEHERGTMEALLLTPTHHHLLARGRFWHLARPWLRFALYMLPVYFSVNFTGILAKNSPMMCFGARIQI